MAVRRNMPGRDWTPAAAQTPAPRRWTRAMVAPTRSLPARRGAGCCLTSGLPMCGGAMDVAINGNPDTSPTPDTALPVDTATMELGPASPVCGTQVPDLSRISGARGIAIDSDGVVYFTRESGTQSWIGRQVPGGAVEQSWLAMPANAQLRSLRVDSARRYLYVSASGVNAVYGVNVLGPVVGVSLTQLQAPHGLALAEDGALFIATGDGHVYRVLIDLATTNRSRATDAPVFPPASGQRPLGLAFGPSGHLFVGSSNGRVRRLRLMDTRLVDPVDHGDFTGTANDLGRRYRRPAVHRRSGRDHPAPAGPAAGFGHRPGEHHSHRGLAGRSGLRPGGARLPGSLRR